MAHSVGELLQSSGSFGISYGLAARDALGEYLGVYGLGMGICRAVAPAILAFTCLQHGTVGWIALAVGFGMSGLATPALVRWAGGCEADTEPEVERAAECDLGLASSC